MIHSTEHHRFLVTGATGTVGREVVKALLENRKKVKVLTRNPQKLENNEMVEVIKGDIRRSTVWMKMSMASKKLCDNCLAAMPPS